MADEDSFFVPEYSLNEGSGPYEVGAQVEAQYLEDEQWYTAEVIEILPDEEIYVVVFLEYGNEQECTVDMLRPRPKPVAKPPAKAVAPPAKAAAPPAKVVPPASKLVMAKLKDSLLDDEDEDDLVEQRASAAREAAKKKVEAAKKPVATAAAVARVDPPVKKATPELPRKAAGTTTTAASGVKKPTPDVPRKSGTAPTRRQLAEQRRKAGKNKGASAAYDDDVSVLHGVDDLNAIVESAECELFASLGELEQASSAVDLMALASTLSELAVLPCTPAADAAGFWKSAFAAAERARESEPDSTGVLTQAGHLHLRHALVLTQQQKKDGNEEFDKAVAQVCLMYLYLFLFFLDVKNLFSPVPTSV